MELYPFYQVLSVSDRHNFTIVKRRCCNFETRGNFLISHQRMVASCFKWVAYLIKKSSGVVLNNTCFSVSDFSGIDYFPAECVDYSLVSKADSKDGYMWSKLSYNVSTYAKVSPVCGVAWARRNDYRIRIHNFDRINGNLLISNDCRFGL